MTSISTCSIEYYRLRQRNDAKRHKSICTIDVASSTVRRLLVLGYHNEVLTSRGSTFHGQGISNNMVQAIHINFIKGDKPKSDVKGCQEVTFCDVQSDTYLPKQTVWLSS